MQGDDAMITLIVKACGAGCRMKTELLYKRYYTENITTDERKELIWRYFISYWNNRRICSANGELPPIIKRQKYYDSLKKAA